MEKKQYLTEFVEKGKKGFKRELGLNKELDSDKLCLQMLDKMQSLPEGCHWGSVAEWKEGINKQIKRGQTAIKNIGLKKFLVEAVEEYLKK